MVELSSLIAHFDSFPFPLTFFLFLVCHVKFPFSAPLNCANLINALDLKPKSAAFVRLSLASASTGSRTHYYLFVRCIYSLLAWRLITNCFQNTGYTSRDSGCQCTRALFCTFAHARAWLGCGWGAPGPPTPPTVVMLPTCLSQYPVSYNASVRAYFVWSIIFSTCEYVSAYVCVHVCVHTYFTGRSSCASPTSMQP